MRKLATRTALIAFGVVLSLPLVELLCRTLGVGYPYPLLESDPYLHHRHPRDYSFVSYTPSREYGGHLVSYDEHGLAFDGRKGERRSCETEYRVAFLGDSFTEAIQVAYADSFVGLLAAANCHTETLNFAVSSYSPAIYVIQWNTAVKSFGPTHVIVQLFSNDIADDEAYLSRARFDSSGNVTAIPGTSERGAAGWLRRSNLVRIVRMAGLQLVSAYSDRGMERVILGGYVEENPDLRDTSALLIRRLRDLVTASGAEFYLTAVPSKGRLEGAGDTDEEMEFARRCELWARAQGIQFIDLVGPFHEARRKKNQRLFFPIDIHLNENGHRVVADAMSRSVPVVFSGGFGGGDKMLEGEHP